MVLDGISDLAWLSNQAEAKQNIFEYGLAGYLNSNLRFRNQFIRHIVNSQVILSILTKSGLSIQVTNRIYHPRTVFREKAPKRSSCNSGAFKEFSVAEV
jgi:hypothetical protein